MIHMKKNNSNSSSIHQSIKETIFLRKNNKQTNNPQNTPKYWKESNNKKKIYIIRQTLVWKQ